VARVSDGAVAAVPGATTAYAPAGLRRSEVVARPPLLREVMLVVVLYGVYGVARSFVEGGAHEALTNARWVWDLERSLFLPNELAMQQWALQSYAGMMAANWYYATLHISTMGLLLVFAWRRWSPADYLWVRRLVFRLTGASFIIYALMPLAPPRLTTELGFVDTVAVLGPAAYDATSARLASQFAAMPSLHVGWAMLLAVVVVKLSRSRWRWLMVAHPIVMVAVVVVTANHFWLDAVASVAVFGVVLRLTTRPSSAPSVGLPARLRSAPT